MDNVQTLRTVLRLKERRITGLADAQKAAKDRLGQEVQALNGALAEEARLRTQEQAQRDKLFDTSSRTLGFRASDVVTLQHLLADAQQRTVAASRQVQKAEQQVEAARGQLQSARQALQRAERQLEQYRDRLKQALRRIEMQQEDQQDEESEEAAAARMLAARRARPAGGRPAGRAAT
jgi:DNA repair exonuclease SbcCD ATPase subunit